MELLDAKMLLDPFEEQFDLPTVSIQLGNAQGGKVEVVGEKHKSLVVFRIEESDAP